MKQNQLKNYAFSRYELTYPAHFTKFGQHDNDGGIVFPQHTPKVLCGARQRTLSGDVGMSVPITLSTGATKINAGTMLFFARSPDKK